MIMCNIDDYIKDLVLYIKTTLDYRTEVTAFDKKQLADIPTAIGASFKFYNANLLDTPVTFAFCKNSSDVTPAQLQKQMQVVERRLNTTVIVLLDNVASYNLQRLVAQRVNFIIPQKQMFIPSLLLNLKKARNTGDDIKTFMTPIAQCIVLYHLQISSLSGMDLKELMNIFGISYSTANRAVRWLESQTVISSTGAKEKKICIDMDKKALWTKALPFFTNPVEKVLRTDAIIPRLMKSGVNALSAYSMINEENREHYAISKDTLKTLDIKVDKNYGENVIEIWRYNPGILSKSGIVDRLSLYLSLKDSKDERIQIELDNMINEIKW